MGGQHATGFMLFSLCKLKVLLNLFFELRNFTSLMRINFYTAQFLMKKTLKNYMFLPNQVVLTCLPTYFFHVQLREY